VKTYSIGFSDERFNELPYAAEVAARFGTDHHEKIAEINALQLLPKIISGFDEPFADSSAIPTYLVSEFARRDVKVVLSGDGGDELFSGYLWTRKEAWLEQYRRAPLSVRNAIAHFFLKDTYRPLRETGWKSLVERFVYDAGLSPWESFARRSMCFQPWMKKELLQPWVQEEVKSETSLELFRLYFERGETFSVMNRLLYLDSKIYLPDDLLTKVDRMSMLHSLEVRVPLLDHQLIETINTIPHSLKLRGRTTKWILKQAMKGLLPDSVLGQRKQGFSIPLGPWFQGKLADAARRLFQEKKSFTGRYVRPEYVDWMLGEHQKGKQRFGAQLYTLLVLELWGRWLEETKGKSGAAPALKDWVGKI
jgi:asparagine synthase (glutamine-hydrolysing)